MGKKREVKGLKPWIETFSPRPRPNVSLLDVEGIINKTINGSKKLKVRQGSDLAMLAYELHRCRFYYYTWDHFKKRAAKAEKVAEEQKAAIMAVINLPDEIVTMELKQLLRGAISNADKKTKEQDFSNPGSAMEWIVGKYLSAIFERTFEREAGFSHHGTTREATGPFVRFVVATMAATGLRYKAASVKTALDRIAEIEEILHGSRPNHRVTHVTG